MKKIVLKKFQTPLISLFLGIFIGVMYSLANKFEDFMINFGSELLGMFVTIIYIKQLEKNIDKREEFEEKWPALESFFRILEVNISMILNQDYKFLKELKKESPNIHLPFIRRIKSQMNNIRSIIKNYDKVIDHTLWYRFTELLTDIELKIWFLEQTDDVELVEVQELINATLEIKDRSFELLEYIKENSEGNIINQINHDIRLYSELFLELLNENV